MIPASSIPPSPVSFTPGFTLGATGDSYAAQIPTAPSFPGFIDSSFVPIVQPPTNPYFTPEIDNTQRELPTFEPVSEEEAKQALDAYVKKHYCYGPMQDVRLDEITMKSAFQYNLTTYIEQRETVWQFEPYTNQLFEGPSVGGLPKPWDYNVKPVRLFVNETKEIKIPNTSNLRQCHTCIGNGRTRCMDCEGRGGTSCSRCRGSGKNADTNEKCMNCDGGRNRCSTCTGEGQLKCKMCDGRSQLYMYLQLIVTWTAHHDIFVSDSAIIPKEKLNKAVGISAVTEANVRLQPLTNFPEVEINRASNDLIQKHSQINVNGLILQQKHDVQIIRIAEVKYNWKAQSDKFHIFGQNNRVYFTKYPQNCYCGCFNCTIM